MRKKIIVFAGGWGGEYLQETLSGISESAFNADTDVFAFVNFAVHTDDPNFNIPDINFFKLPDISIFDGAVFLANSFNSSEELEYLTSEIKKYQIPMISTEYEIPGYNYISTDNYSGMYDLVTHLIQEHNAGRLVFVAGPKDHPESNERLQAFRDSCTDNNIASEPDNIYYADWSKGMIPSIIDNYLEDHSLPDAFVFANDIMAMTGCEHLRTLGYTVPDDVMVTGFDCINEARTYNPPIASVNHEWYTMGLLAFEQINKLINHEDTKHSIQMKTRFVPGGTCGCTLPSFKRSDTKPLLKRALTDYQMDTLLIDSHFRHFYNAVKKATNAEELFNNFSYLFSHLHIIEGNKFELYIDPEFFNITDDNSNLHISGHPDKYLRLTALNDTQALPLECVSREDALISAASRSENADYYVYVPLYSEAYTLGFAVINGKLNAASENQYYMWTRHMIQALEQVRSNITISTLYDKMRILSETDSLTGVYNRTGCQMHAYTRMIEHTSQGGTSVVMLVDVDNMKHINDRFGHSCGDNALVIVTQIMKSSLPQSYVISRFGGDEFLIAGCLDNNDQDIDALIDNVELNLSEYISAHDITFPLTISIGYAKIKPSDITDIEKGIVLSDKNMYTQKKLHHQDI